MTGYVFAIATLLPPVRRYLEQKGCTITEKHGRSYLALPAGTIQGDEQIPRVSCARYTYSLPDGTLLEAHHGQETSYLYVPAEALQAI